MQYFLREVNPENGLVKDATRKESPCSITATGLGLTAYTVGVVRGWIDSGFFWDLMKKCPYLVEGLRRAGFEGAWLEPGHFL